MSQDLNANRIQKGSLAIDKQMYDFIENEVLPKVGVDSESYWSGFEKVVKEFLRVIKPCLRLVMRCKSRLINGI